MDKTRTSRKPHPAAAPMAPASAKLTVAELSIQRGEFDNARQILERRIAQGVDDFQTRNLLGISLANLARFDEAARVFRFLNDANRAKDQRVRTAFNLALVLFYDDLTRTGDMTVARYRQAAPAAISVNAPSRPFAAAIELWERLLRGKSRYADIIHTYLSFAYLQSGDLNRALSRLRSALTLHENFYITHYTLGRVFMDLYYLAEEGNDFALPREMATFFEIEDYEVVREVDGLFVVQKDTFLDISMQAFAEARALSPMSPEVALCLCQAYILAGMLEEAEETLNQAEMYAPDSQTTLETALWFHERVQAPPEAIAALIGRIKRARRDEARRVFSVMPSHFLF